MVSGGPITSIAVYGAMYQGFANMPWTSWGNSDVQRSYHWVSDINTVVEKRIPTILSIDHAGIDPHTHFGGLTDNGTIQLGAGDSGAAGLTATKIVSTGGGAFIDLAGGADNVAETAGGDIIHAGNTYSSAQAGNQFIHLTSKDASQDTTVIFGTGGGHTVIKSDIGIATSDNPTPNPQDAFNPVVERPGPPAGDDKQTADSGTYKGLNNLHIVLDGLGANDVTFYYKQVGIAPYYGGTGVESIATVAGYIKINATGETLALPDADLGGFFKGSPDLTRLPAQYGYYYSEPGSSFLDMKKNYALKLPTTFSITFGDGSVYAGTQATALFTTREPDEFTKISGEVVYGPTRNAPDKDLTAEQNGGGGGGGTVVASSGASSVTGTSASERIDSSGTASLAVGGGGDDTYVYNQGYGALTVDNTDGANNGNEGTVQFGQGITAASLTFSTAGTGSADLAVAVPGTTAGSVTVAAALASNGYGRIKQFAFADGSSLSFAAIKAALPAGASGTAALAGTTQNFFGQKEQDSFVRTGTGAVQVTSVDGTGTVLFSNTLTRQNGATFTLDAATTVIGAGVNFLPAFSAGAAATYGDTAFLRDGGGALSVDQFDGGGTLVRTQALTYNGVALTVDATTTVVGAGQDYYGNGGHTLFLRENGGLTVINEFDGNGSFTAGQALTNQGARLFIDGTTAVVGAGQDFFGIGERTVFLRDGGALIAWAFDASGVLNAARVLQTMGFDAAASVAGGGEDFLGNGERAVFVYGGAASGSLAVELFDATGALVQTLALGTNGRVGTASSGTAVDAGTTVVGGGEDFFGTVGHAAFLRSGGGALGVAEFDATGAATGYLGLSSQGAALSVDTATTVIGGGEDFFGTGQRTAFVRGGDGSLHAWGVDASGSLTRGADFTIQGAAVAVDTGTTVVGAGENFFGNGQQTVFLRGANGSLHAWGFNGTGAIASGQDFSSGGSPFVVDTGTTVVGGGEDFFGNGRHAAFMRGSDGSLGVLNFTAAGSVDIRQAFTIAGGAALVIDTGTTVTGGAGDYFQTGGHGIYVQDAGGARHVWEFDAGGIRTGVA